MASKTSSTVLVLAIGAGAVLLMCGGGTCGLAMLGAANRKGPAPAVSASAPSAHGVADEEVSVGDFCEVRIKSDPTATVPVFESEEGMDEWVHAASVDDDHGQRRAIAKDGFIVTGGTRCKKIEGGFSKVRVRILEGPHDGKAGWVAREWARTVI